MCQGGKFIEDCNACTPESNTALPCLPAGIPQTPILMEQSTTPKRKPGRPRKQRPAPESNSSETNPLEATIKAARSAYEPSNRPRGPIVPRGTQGTDKGEATAMGTDRLGVGAAILSPSLPVPRARGKLTPAAEYASSFSNEQVEMWATAWLCSGNRQRWLREAQPLIGRENDRWRADLIKALEANPIAQETVARLKEEAVMSDLQRRKLLKEIAHAPEHGLRGYADNLKAIELDSKADPESVENKRRSEAANSLTFNAPVSLFFMPSTQARAIQPTPEPKAIEVVAKDCTDIRYNDKDPAALPLPPVGGTPGT